MEIGGKDARTCMGMVIQFYLLARSADVRAIRACDVKRTTQAGLRCLEITFRQSKNDQFHAGEYNTYVF